MNDASMPVVRAGISEQEWQIRCDLAALYRLVAHFRMTDLIYTHISARLPGDEHHFLINQYGVMFHDMRASDLVKIDLDGNVVGPDAQRPHRVNKAGFVIHSAVHAAREDVMCVAHTHTAAGIAVSAQKHGLLPISQHALKFYGRVGYHDYEGIALDTDERARLVRDLGDNDVMILRNHGLLVCGGSIQQAWDRLYFLERACQAQVAALAGGAELVMPSEAVCRHTAGQGRTQGEQAMVELAWNASLTMIEGQGHDWRG
jgi:ribulose-5-phosphate 4-epimerase/fuculose-1-phosphate aldolase